MGAISVNAEEMPLLLSVPTKRTEPVTWSKSLIHYIQTAFALDANKFTQDGATLDKLRKDSLSDLTPSIETLDRLYLYYSQISFIGSRFPMDVGLAFPWYPGFEAKAKPVSMNSIAYERACVLFCIGAIYTQLGCLESKVSSEGVRKASNYFQNAAGCFKYIETDIISDLSVPSPAELSPQTLSALVSINLAQAQECMWQKAVMEHMKHGTIARLAIKVADFYQAVLQTSKPEAASEIAIPPEWQSYAEIKAAYFTAVAQYQKANECISQGRYGEEIGRLHLATSYNQKALEGVANTFTGFLQGGGLILHSEFQSEVRHLQECIDRDLLRAEKDNSLVYLETVPSAAHLAPILRSDMVRSITPPDVLDPTTWKKNPEEQNHRPLFESLIPYVVYLAANVYRDRKAYVVKVDIVDRCRELQEACDAVFNELGLPSSVDMVDPQTIPATLSAYAEEVQHEGGPQALHDMLDKVYHMSIKTSELVEDGFNMLEEENEQDEIFQRQFGSLWTRPPSQQLTGTLLAQGAKYHDTLQAAQKADRIVRAKMSNWGKAIDMLSRPVPELIAHLPSIADNETTPHFTQIVELMKRLRSLMQECDEAAEQRKQIVAEAEALQASDDITEALLHMADTLMGGSAVVKVKPEQFESVFSSEMKKYERLQNQTETCHKEQTHRLQRIREVFEQFSLLIQGNPVIAKREKAILNLEQAFGKFKEIRTNLVEGIKFYSQYTDTLTQFRDACVDFALARRMEASELARNNAKRR